MIGDTPYDIEAATKAQVRIIAFRSGAWGDTALKGAADIYDGPADPRSRRLGVHSPYRCSARTPSAAAPTANMPR